MANLITRTDIALYKQISKTVYDDVLNPFISDAQFTDVQPLMGADFYFDMIANSGDANYQALLKAGTYSYQGETYTTVGLEAVIAHFAYARYIMFGSQVDTPFGFQEKTNENSNNVSVSGKKTIYKMNQQMAQGYWENVELFLIRKADDYPKWNNSCFNKSGTFRISKIG